jgi:hypothetical protein
VILAAACAVGQTGTVVQIQTAIQSASSTGSRRRRRGVPMRIVNAPGRFDTSPQSLAADVGRWTTLPGQRACS